MQDQTILDNYKKNKHTSCNLIIIDNFYNNPLEIRDFAIKQEYFSNTHYPGKRTKKSFATIDIKHKIQSYIEPLAGKITKFEMYNDDNGRFQYATTSDKTWIHSDHNSIIDTNWGGVIYLTPDAPLNSGTSFYRLRENNISDNDERSVLNINIEKYGQDYSKWDVVDYVGNVFNRLILFNSKRFHCSSNYFGKDINDGRLFQVFFFKTELDN